MARSRLVYDDDCGFCTRAAETIGRRSTIELVPFSAVTDDLRTALPPNWRECAHLVTDDRIYSCGAAMEEAAARAGIVSPRLVRALRRVPGHDAVLETGYRLIAANRPLVSRVTRRWI
ncbi:MAG: DCC1-like thiol-disulfide oxidoreductase family protein [Halobacteriales archaeon]|nr:DCC1-like thiol-disulfide oxidoreductase family protein [Halobacteriales archaeon]